MNISTNRHSPRIGEILLEYGLITHEQLTRALDRQVQNGMKLGSILEDFGYLDIDTLLSVLSRQHGLPYINLFEVKVPPDVLSILPFERVKTLKVLPFRKNDETLSLAMVDPLDMGAIQNVEIATKSTVKPFIVPNSQMDRAISCFEKEGYGEVVFEGEKLKEEKVSAGSSIPGIFTLFKLVTDFRATDLHLTAGAPPSMRISNEIKRLSMPAVSTAQMRDFTSEVLRKDQIEEFERENELDFVLSLSDTGRFGVNIYKQRNSISLSARLIHETVPSMADLNLPEWITDYSFKSSGLILITGLAGQGKTTTIASLVDSINSSKRRNIVTLEDPIKYLHRHKLSNVNQREVGIDTGSYAAGLRHVVRQDPDVIVVGELRDADSISIALNAAETGHLVICSMHSLNAVTALEKILNIFSESQLPQIKMQLADTLLLAFSQKLLPLEGDGGKVLAYEKIVNSDRVLKLIREGKISNIRSLMQINADDVSALESSIARLYLEGKISLDVGLKYSDTPSHLQDLIKSGRI